MHRARPPIPFALAFVLSALLAAPALAAAPDAIVGTWATEKTENGWSKVEISPETDGTYDVTIVWLSDPTYEAGDGVGRVGEPKCDLENPDPDLRERPIVGLVIGEGFEHRGGNRWVGGSIYDPESGNTYKAKMKLVAPDRLELRGYVGVPMFGRTSEWTRVE